MKKEGTNFKIVVVGDNNVGKTTFINKMEHLKMEQKYITTAIICHKSMLFSTNRGTIILDLWDPVIQYGVKDSFYLGSDAAIILFDLQSRNSFKSIPQWLKDIKRVCGDIPIIICGNKIDSNPTIVNSNLIDMFIQKRNLKYFEICSLDGYNCFDVIFEITKQLFNDTNLNII